MNPILPTYYIHRLSNGVICVSKDFGQYIFFEKDEIEKLLEVINHLDIIIREHQQKQTDH